MARYYLGSGGRGEERRVYDKQVARLASRRWVDEEGRYTVEGLHAIHAHVLFARRLRDAAGKTKKVQERSPGRGLHVLTTKGRLRLVAGTEEQCRQALEYLQAVGIKSFWK